MYCSTRIPALSSTGLTSLRSAVRGGAGGVAGLAIYADADAGAPIAKGSVAVTADQVVSITGLASYTIVAGVAVRVCFCSSNNGLFTAESNYNGDPISNLANAFTTQMGTAANPCVAGVPPATTGVLSALNFEPAVVAVE
jgi:hypothetical protein